MIYMERERERGDNFRFLLTQSFILRHLTEICHSKASQRRHHLFGINKCVSFPRTNPNFVISDTRRLTCAHIRGFGYECRIDLKVGLNVSPAALAHSNNTHTLRRSSWTWVIGSKLSIKSPLLIKWLIIELTLPSGAVIRRPASDKQTDEYHIAWVL